MAERRERKRGPEGGVKHQPGRETCAPRRKFHGPWDEIEYLYNKVLYWFYQHTDRRRAAAFADRLKRLLGRTPGVRDAILGNAARSLVHEVAGDLPRAIAAREREVALIKRLQASAVAPAAAGFLARYCGTRELSDSLDILATLYHAAGRRDRAVAVLRESEAVCKRAGRRFDGRGLLRAYQAEGRGVKVG